MDTFFFMSGLLVGYLSFIELDKKRFNLLMFYILRYVRLTIPLAFAIGYSATLFVPMIPGPLTEFFGQNDACMGRSWWETLLYVNIYTGPACMGHTWYLSAEWNMFLFSPVVMLPMYYLSKWGSNKYGIRKWLWLMVWSLFFIGFTMVPIGMVLRSNLAPYGIL